MKEKGLTKTCKSQHLQTHTPIDALLAIGVRTYQCSFFARLACMMLHEDYLAYQNGLKKNFHAEAVRRIAWDVMLVVAGVRAIAAHNGVLHRSFESGYFEDNAPQPGGEPMSGLSLKQKKSTNVLQLFFPWGGGTLFFGYFFSTSASASKLALPGWHASSTRSHSGTLALKAENCPLRDKAFKKPISWAEDLAENKEKSALVLLFLHLAKTSDFFVCLLSRF